MVAIDSQDGEWESRSGVLDRGEHPFLGLVTHLPCFGPPGRNVSDIEGETELSTAVAAFIADQIDLHKPGTGVVSLSPGAHRDRVLQQRAGLGMRPPTWIQFGLARLEPAVDRGRRDLQQPTRRRIIDIELTEPPQPEHQVRQRRRQQPAARCSPHRPQEPQSPQSTDSP